MLPLIVSLENCACPSHQKVYTGFVYISDNIILRSSAIECNKSQPPPAPRLMSVTMDAPSGPRRLEYCYAWPHQQTPAPTPRTSHPLTGYTSWRQILLVIWSHSSLPLLASKTLPSITISQVIHYIAGVNWCVVYTITLHTHIYI